MVRGAAAVLAGALALASCRLAVNGLEALPRDGGTSGDAHAPDAGKLLEDGGTDAIAEAAADVLATVAPPEFAWYLLDETSGTTAHDSTGHYDITNLTGVTWGQGASFDGTGGGGYVLVSSTLRRAPLSFTAWLTPDSRVDEGATTHGINPFPPNAVSGDVPGSYGFGIGLNVWSGGSALSVEDVGYAFQNVAGAPFVAGTEYFVVAAIGSATTDVYVDGQLVGQAATKPPGTTPGSTLSLGFHNTDPLYLTKRFFAGRMRDVRIYERVLTAAEVGALAAAGPKTGP